MRGSNLTTAGTLIGIGMGGFVDGIVFHQILQIHNMMSARMPPDDLVSAKANMVWDGYFHAGTWIVTMLGIALLVRSEGAGKAVGSTSTFWGAWLSGWGLFNLVEGLIDHQLLGLHHVYEYTPDKLPYDLAFLASGVLFLLVGRMIVRRGATERRSA